MELDEVHGSEKYIPSPNFLFLPAALGHGMVVWSRHLGGFVHSFPNEPLCLFINMAILSYSRHIPTRQV